MLTDIITGPSRRKFYVTYAIIGVIIGGTQVALASAELGQPIWLASALAVYAFLGTAFGFTASANVPGMGGRHEATKADWQDAAHYPQDADGYPIPEPHPATEADPERYRGE